MAEYKPNGRFWFITLLNFALSAMSAYAVIFTFKNEIKFSGRHEGMTEETLIYVFGFAAACFLISGSAIVLHLIKNKGNVMTVSYEGVSNGLVISMLGCFFIIIPVKFIPWQAITEVDDEQNGLIVARLETSKIKANPLAKLILKITGFNFCSGLITPALHKEDIMMFSDLFTVKSSLQR